MIKKVTIKNVKISESKYGSDEKFVYKNGPNAGKNFVMVTIQTEETGDEYYSTPCLPGGKPSQLKEGDSVLLSLTTRMSVDGQKEFKNFNFPTKDELAKFAAEMA